MSKKSIEQKIRKLYAKRHAIEHKAKRAQGKSLATLDARWKQVTRDIETANRVLEGILA